MARSIVYTCVFDNYDVIFAPIVVTPDVDYILLTDDPTLTVEGWTTLIVKRVMGCSSLTNRYYKIIGPDLLGQYSTSIYVDGNIRILGDLSPLIADFRQAKYDIGLFLHPSRNTVAEEVDACIGLGKVSCAHTILLEHQLLREQGFLDQGILTENNVLIRSNFSAPLRNAMTYWWKWVLAHSGRDQISLPYVRQKFQLSERVYPYNARTPNPFFGRYPHRRKGFLKYAYAYLGARSFESRWNQFLYNVTIKSIRHSKNLKDLYQKKVKPNAKT